MRAVAVLAMALAVMLSLPCIPMAGMASADSADEAEETPFYEGMEEHVDIWNRSLYDKYIEENASKVKAALESIGRSLQ